MADFVPNAIDLWKAIHGGCWPGPQPDVRLTAQVNEVISGFALLNMAHGFNDVETSRQVRAIAVASLGKSLVAAQQTIKG